MPHVLGVLVVIAGAGYCVDSFGMLLLPHYTLKIAVFTFIGELLLMFWLLFRGSVLPSQAE